MRTKAIFQRKEPCLEPQACEIEKVITLPDREFAQFQQQLLRNYNFIADNAENLCIRDGVAHCLLVVGESSEDGILVNSEGCSYARYAAYFPAAKSFLLTQDPAHQVVQVEPAPSVAESPSVVAGISPALLAYGERMTQILDEALEEALEGHDQSTYIFSLEQLRDAHDDGSFDASLFTAMLVERTEVVDMDLCGEEVMVTLSLEAIQAHEASKLRELSQEDVIIMQAKHTLWCFDAGGEQADFSGCRLSDVSMVGMEFNGAVFQGAVLENVNLHNAGVCFGQFQGARFVGCDMANLMAEECDFSGAVFDHCNLSGARLAHSNFSHVQFLDTDLLASDMRNCCIESAAIDERQTDGIHLTGASDEDQAWGQGDDIAMGGIVISHGAIGPI